MVSFRIDGRAYTKKVHRLVCETFSSLPTNKEVNHVDGVKTNNHLDNLQVCSHQENHIHLRQILGKLMGERVGTAKLTTNQVVEIRKMRDEGASIKEIAKHFDQQVKNIERIIRRDRWKHVP